MLILSRVSSKLISLAGVCAALVLAASTAPALAQESAALYQATAIVTGVDMRQRPLGFSTTLMEVLVKVSGAPRLRRDAAAIALTKQADKYVDDFAYVDPRAGLLHHDDQGTYDRSHELTVRFNRAKIDAALTTLGAPVWRGPRPVLTPVILVRNREPTPFLLSSETPRGAELRETMVRLAAENGVGVRFPTEAEFASWGVGLIGPPTPLGSPEPGRLQIAGTLSWNVQAMGWIGAWRLWQGQNERSWDIKGVSFDLALANLIEGAVAVASTAANP